MKTRIRCLLAALICLLMSTVYAETPAPTVNHAAEVVQRAITAYMNKNAIPGVAVELYIDGKPQAYYFGYADLEKKKPVTEKTIFELGSITKVMTGILFAEKLDAASMQLNQPVKQYLPDLGTDFNSITLLNLATHTSSLPFALPENIKTREQADHYLASWQPGSTPGAEWIYSNAGIGLLGYALEAESHKSMNDLYVKNILLPLKMQPIGFTVSKRYKPFYAQGHDKDGNPVAPSEPGVFPASYFMKASAGDMQRFLSTVIGLPGTPESLFYPMRMTQAGFVELPTMTQGLVWTIHPLSAANVSMLLNEPEYMNKGPLPVKEISEKPIYDGKALIDKTGATPGFRAYIAAIPSKKAGIVILANKSIHNADTVKVGRDILFKLSGVTN